MSRWNWLYVGLVVASGLLGLASGYNIAKHAIPARIEERVVIKEVVKWQERIVKVESTNQQASAQENVKVVTRWRVSSDGTKTVEQSRERSSSAASAAASESSSTRQAAGESTASSNSTRLTVYPPKRPWSINVLGGLSLDWKRHYGATLTRDIGPSTVGIWVLPAAQAAGVSLGFRF